MQYTENFQYRIQQLKLNYEKDYIIRHCSRICGSKRFKPISYNSDDPLAFMYVKTYTIILARILSIKGDLSDKHIKEVSSKVNISPFEAKIKYPKKKKK